MYSPETKVALSLRTVGHDDTTFKDGFKDGSKDGSKDGFEEGRAVGSLDGLAVGGAGGAGDWGGLFHKKSENKSTRRSRF